MAASAASIGAIARYNVGVEAVVAVALIATAIAVRAALFAAHFCCVGGRRFQRFRGASRNGASTR